MSGHRSKKWNPTAGTMCINQCWECGAMNPHLVGREPKPTTCAVCGIKLGSALVRDAISKSALEKQKKPKEWI